MHSVKVTRVDMVENGDGWDAHVHVGTENPSIDLGSFVMSGLKRPQDYKDRFDSEFEEFLSKIDGKSYQVES